MTPPKIVPQALVSLGIINTRIAGRIPAAGSSASKELMTHPPSKEIDLDSQPEQAGVLASMNANRPHTESPATDRNNYRLRVSPRPSPCRPPIRIHPKSDRSSIRSA